MRKIASYAKLIPLFLVGVAVIVWGILFQRSSVKDKQMDGSAPSSQNDFDETVFPY